MRHHDHLETELPPIPPPLSPGEAMLATRLRRLLSHRPRREALCLRVISCAGWPQAWKCRAWAVLDVARVRIDGEWHWALPQHQELGGDVFDDELRELLDAEAGGSVPGLR